MEYFSSRLTFFWNRFIKIILFEEHKNTSIEAVILQICCLGNFIPLSLNHFSSTLSWRPPSSSFFPGPYLVLYPNIVIFPITPRLNIILMRHLNDHGVRTRLRPRLELDIVIVACAAAVGGVRILFVAKGFGGVGGSTATLRRAFTNVAPAHVVNGLKGGKRAADDDEKGLGSVPEEEVILSPLVVVISDVNPDNTHSSPRDVQIVRLGKLGSFDSAANAGKYACGHEQAQSDALLDADFQIPEYSNGDESKAEVNEDVPAWKDIVSKPLSGKYRLFECILELKIVTSVMITGFQQFASIRKFHRPSEGVQAVKRRIEFNALIRSVETMANHKNRVRQ